MYEIKKQNYKWLIIILIFFFRNSGITPRSRDNEWKRDGRRKSLGGVLESYDKKDPVTNYSQEYGIKFDIKSKRHRSIEMMFQKRANEQINLARDDDIFE